MKHRVAGSQRFNPQRKPQQVTLTGDEHAARALRDCNRADEGYGSGNREAVVSALPDAMPPDAQVRRISWETVGSAGRLQLI
jgi:hypothetical protein